LKPSVLVTREIFEEVLAHLRGRCEVEDNQSDRPLPGPELIERLSEKDGALVTVADRIDRSLLGFCPRLRAISTVAVGYDNIDVAACTARGIVVTNTPGVLTETTADHAWALLMAAARRIAHADRWVRSGQWSGWRFKDWLGLDIHGTTLGVIGMGRIGQAVAKRSRGFEMRVLYHNRNRLAPEIEAACNAEPASKDELLRNSDFIVLTLPHTPQTHHLIGAPELALMKPTSLVVNIGRGGVVDDVALVEALAEGRIAAAGLDVFEDEPTLESGFLSLPNVVLTPHIGSASHATRHKMAMMAAENLVAALSGGRPPNPVNPEVLQGR
jgi:gluconate 2-dehydrogenase